MKDLTPMEEEAIAARIAKDTQRLAERHNASFAHAAPVLPTPGEGKTNEKGQHCEAEIGWKVEALRASAIIPEPISWIWPGYIARGKITVLAGAGGDGKTTLLLGLIAIITTGGFWPDGSRYSSPGHVVIWSGEDDARDTLVPRLIAAGADLDRVHIILGRVDDRGEREPFDPAVHIGSMYEAIREIGGVHLVMIDPLMSAIKGDAHRANDVRRGLQVVVDMAAAADCAVVGISHFAKGSAGSSPADRVIGSQAFGALARTVLVTAKEEDGETRVLARAKSNIALDTGGVQYTVESATLGNGIETTRVVWGEALEGSSRDILADIERRCDMEEVDEPVETLRDVLREGPMPSKQAEAVMKRSGFTDKQIRRAREKLGVVSSRSGFGADLVSYWSLPDGPKPSGPTGPGATVLPLNVSSAHSLERAKLDTEGKTDKKTPTEKPICQRCAGEGCAHCGGGR
ncbi:AAA family ATPase [Microbulbifer sp.]|uniref:AAA family ATPase n=1 Tax=Microbulbifer sp. TaxID=1908541 RepID=UPI003F2A8FB3